MRTILLALTAAAVFGQTQKLAIAPGGSNRLALKVYKTGIYKGKIHDFEFPRFQGALNFDPKNPESSSVELTIAAGEIKLLDTWLSAKDFKSVHEYAVKDMLNVEKFKEIAYKSTGVKAVDATHLEVQGQLTIRGVSKPVVLLVTLTGQQFDGKAVIKLTAFGLKPPSAALGLIGTKDEMDFTFTIVPSGS